MKPTIANLKRVAAKIGATVDCKSIGLDWSCYVDLPAGKVIDGAHGLAETTLASDKTGQRELIAKLIEIITTTPVEDGCDESDPSQCETCNPSPEDE